METFVFLFQSFFRSVGVVDGREEGRQNGAASQTHLVFNSDGEYDDDDVDGEDRPFDESSFFVDSLELLLIFIFLLIDEFIFLGETTGIEQLSSVE